MQVLEEIKIKKEKEKEQEQKLAKKPSQILRETKYKQAFGSFKYSNRYCASGVLLKSLGWNGIDSDDHGSNFEEAEKKFYNMLPLDIVFQLQTMNDNYTPFSELADWLEEKGY